MGLAKKTLAGCPQRAADAEDAVQSAFASFFQRASAEKFEVLSSRKALWKLLGVITVRKSRQLARRELAARRGGGRVADQGAVQPTSLCENQLEQLASRREQATR